MLEATILALEAEPKLCEFEMLSNVFIELQNDYYESTASIILDYYGEKSDSVSLYTTIIISGDFVNRINSLSTAVEQSLEKYISMHGTEPETVKVGAERHEGVQSSMGGKGPLLHGKLVVKLNPSIVDPDICVCGRRMVTEQLTSELVCDHCGAVVPLHGTIFKDTQFYNQEGQSQSKHGSYDTNRHCKAWLDHIQAKDQLDPDPKCMELLEQCLRRDNVIRKTLTCMQVRNYLKEIGYSKYNYNVPLIRKYVSGIIPYQLTFTEEETIKIDFAKATEIWESIKPSSKPNTPYYPHFIFKIIEHRLRDRQKHMYSLLECIHLQSSVTSEKNDEYWQIMCQRMGWRPEAYRPTDVTMFAP
jgi:hypothetical protein